jgi:hypothetical protein
MHNVNFNVLGKNTSMQLLTKMLGDLIFSRIILQYTISMLKKTLEVR